MPVPAVVLVEGESDRVALLTLGDALGAQGLEVRAMGGVTNLRAHLARVEGPVAGLYDAPAADWVHRVLVDADVPVAGFHACRDDLEDELLRALGPDAVERVVADAGESRALRRLAAMPAQRGWSRERVLQRFLTSRGGRKARYARLFVEALVARDGTDGAPAPLRAVLAEVGIGPVVRGPTGGHM